MKILMTGHDHRYAVEQLALSLISGEEIEFVEELPSDGDRAESCLRLAPGTVISTTKMWFHGAYAEATAHAKRPADGDGISEKRAIDYALRISLYRAAKKCAGICSPWGALTGIRPAKIAEKMLADGMDEADTSAMLKKKYDVSAPKRKLMIAEAKAGAEVERKLDRRDIALYVGVPFCPSRCAYCSFVAGSIDKWGHLINPYLDALKHEIDGTAKLLRDTGVRVRAVYFGGGTPTSITAEQLDSLMMTLGSCFDLSNLWEYTVEAGRFDTITPEKLETIARRGADRISLNPQSTNPQILKAVGRPYTEGDFARAMTEARRVGFHSINADLIAGLPGETEKGFLRSVNDVLALTPENITIHNLAIKRGSNFHADGVPMPLPGEQAVAKMLARADGILDRNGYRPYYTYRQKYTALGLENTGFSLSGHESPYNVIIMEELATIISFGAGGVTKLVHPDTHFISRLNNHKYPLEYIENIERCTTDKEKVREMYLSIE